MSALHILRPIFLPFSSQQFCSSFIRLNVDNFGKQFSGQHEVKSNLVLVFDWAIVKYSGSWINVAMTACQCPVGSWTSCLSLKIPADGSWFSSSVWIDPLHPSLWPVSQSLMIKSIPILNDCINELIIRNFSPKTGRQKFKPISSSNNIS